MKLGACSVGDIVLVNKKGRRFHAKVVMRSDSALRFIPIERGITYQTCTAREVEQVWINVGRWSKK